MDINISLSSNSRWVAMVVKLIYASKGCPWLFDKFVIKPPTAKACSWAILLNGFSDILELICCTNELMSLPVPHIYDGELGQVGIGSRNSLSSVRRQAIPWINAALLSIGHVGTNFSEIRIEIKLKRTLFIHADVFENVVCEMVAILSRGRWVNIYTEYQNMPFVPRQVRQECGMRL